MPGHPRPRLVVLLVALAAPLVTGCDHDEFGPTPDPPQICEVEDSTGLAPTSGLLGPSADFRIRCGAHYPIAFVSAAIGREHMFVLADQADPGSERLYRIGDDGSISTLRVAGGSQLAVNDGGDVHLFGAGFGDPWRLLLEPDAEPVDLDFEPISRLEFLGDRLHLWFGDGRHASENDEGVWSVQPAIVVEGHPHFLSSLDGSGGQTSYALDDLAGTDNYDLWSFDGHSTNFVGVLDYWGRHPSVVPTGHPVDPKHEHAIYHPTWSGVRLWWPRRSPPVAIDIPLSSTYAEVDDHPCLWPYGLTATRTADGRVWLAWIVGLDGSACEDDPAVIAEAGTLRLVEVDPAQSEARELMRVPLEVDSIVRSDFGIWVYYDYPALSLAAYGEELAIVLGDGPADQALRVLRVDTSEGRRAHP